MGTHHQSLPHAACCRLAPPPLRKWLEERQRNQQLQAEAEARAQYEVVVATSSVKGAGSDARVYINITGYDELSNTGGAPVAAGATCQLAVPATRCSGGSMHACHSSPASAVCEQCAKHSYNAQRTGTCSVALSCPLPACPSVQVTCGWWTPALPSLPSSAALCAASWWAAPTWARRHVSRCGTITAGLTLTGICRRSGSGGR